MRLVEQSGLNASLEFYRWCSNPNLRMLILLMLHSNLPRVAQSIYLIVYIVAYVRHVSFVCSEIQNVKD